MASIHELIAAIVPNPFCDLKYDESAKKPLREVVKEMAKKEGYAKAAGKAKPYTDSIALFNLDKATKDPFGLWGLKSPIEQHEIVYDSPAEGLEPLYFWVLDFAQNGFFQKVEKIVDNFSSSVGSGHFSELQGKATRMQDEVMKMLGGVNQVVKSILNIIYDLKEFKSRLQIYNQYNKSSGEEKASALLSLKQIWLDNVDIKRGNTSIKGLAISGANQPNFVTLLDAFMAADNLKKVEELDLNERVKRILRQRVNEFLIWIKESEKELRKRYDIEVNYLKSQYSTVKLYAKWLRPYLDAARKLEQGASASMQPALVSAFNTLSLELTLLCTSGYSPAGDVTEGILPESFKNITKKKYRTVVIIEFKFRGIPQKVGQHYTFGGKTNIKFTSYALTEKEIDLLKKEMDADNVSETLKLIEGATSESLEKLEEDIKSFIDEAETKEKKEEKKESEDTNPFTSLFSFTSFFKNSKKESKDTPGSDNDYEKVIRSQAIIAARDQCFNIFDIYKKAHGMPSHPNPYAPFG